MNSKLKYSVKKNINKSLKCKIIDLPIYHCSIKLLFGDTAKKLEKDWGNSDNFGGLTRNYLKENGDIIISFIDKKPKIEYIVHEFHHAVDMIMNHIGHKKNLEGDEPSAYLIGYLINEYAKLK